MDVVLTIDVLLLVAAATRIAIRNDSALSAALLSLLNGTVVASAFLGWRMKHARSPGRVPSDAPARRMLGVLLLGVGATMSLLSGLCVAAATWSALSVRAATASRRAAGDGEYELIVTVVVLGALVLGNVIMYIGALVRSQPPRPTALPLGGTPF
jgi:hypothetical protein